MLLDFVISALLMESVSYAHKVIDWTVLKTSAQPASTNKVANSAMKTLAQAANKVTP